MKLQMLCTEVNKKENIAGGTVSEEVFFRPTLQENDVAMVESQDTTAKKSHPNGQFRIFITNAKSFGKYKQGIIYILELKQSPIEEQPEEVQEFLKQKK